jgi:acetyl esterase
MRQWKTWLAALIGGAGAAQATPASASPAPASPPPAAAAPVAALPPAAGRARPAQLPYKTTAQGRLKLHIAWPPERFTGPRPCVLFFHGGGWRSGQPKQFMAFAERLAAHGVVGMSVQYRLLGEGEVLPLPAIQDARSAMRFVRAKATELGCDPRRIGAGGGSSGGHLAAMTAAVVADSKAATPAGPIDDPADDPRISPRPDALFLMNAPLNLERYNDRPVPLDQRRQLSPTLRLDGSWPATWIFHGTGDKVVPFSQTAEFRDRAKAVGAGEVTVHAFNGRTHGFFNTKRNGGGDFEAVVDGLVAGLKKLGWVD